MLSSDIGNMDTVPLPASEVEDVRHFLSSVFRISLNSPLLAPPLLDWKFFTPHPYWEGPRSYVMKDDGRIVAHSCIWPVQFSLGDQTVSSMHLIDWAASKDAPGAGALLNRELMTITGNAIGLGASATGLKVARRMGFEQYGSVGVYARVLRPWRQFLSRPQPRSWKLPAYLVRNAIWSGQPLHTADRSWRTVQTPQFDATLSTILERRLSSPFYLPVRTIELLNYFLECPGVSSQAFLVYEGTALRGYFILARVGVRVMVTDVWIDSPNESEWATAFSLAVRRGTADPMAQEFVAFSSIPLVTRALLRNHFHLRAEKPLLIFDPNAQFKDFPLFVTPFESDAFYLYEQNAPFLT